MLNRRQLLKRLAAAGMIAAAPQLLAPERRYWQLDQTMTNRQLEPVPIIPLAQFIVYQGYWYVGGQAIPEPGRVLGDIPRAVLTIGDQDQDVILYKRGTRVVRGEHVGWEVVEDGEETEA